LRNQAVQWRRASRSCTNSCGIKKKACEELVALWGIIPICSSCHAIRDDIGFWERVDIYLAKTVIFCSVMVFVPSAWSNSIPSCRKVKPLGMILSRTNSTTLHHFVNEKREEFSELFPLYNRLCEFRTDRSFLHHQQDQPVPMFHEYHR